MAKTHKVPFVQDLKTEVVTFLPGDTSPTTYTLYTAGTEGGLVVHLNAVNSDVTDRAFAIMVTANGETIRQLGTVIVPALSGTDGVVPSKNLLDPTQIALNADGSYPLEPSAAISLRNESTLGGGFIDFIADCGDY